MKKIDLGQTVSVIANVCVIAGIVFLGFELRQNTIAVRSEASQGIQSQIADIYSTMSNDRIAAIYLKGASEPNQLDPTERVLFNAYLGKVLAALENLFAQVNEGSYDESRALGQWQLMRNILEYPGIRAYWENTNYIFSDSFRAHVENVVMALEPLPGTALLQTAE